MNREVDHPLHYYSKGMEVIDVIESYDLDFHLGNAIKYILRAGKKGGALQDLEKAVWYLGRKIEGMSRNEVVEARKGVEDGTVQVDHITGCEYTKIAGKWEKTKHGYELI